MATSGGERIVTASPTAAAGGRVIASPFQFYVDGADNLRVEGWNSLAGVTLQVYGRFLNEKGQVDVFNHQVALTADRARTSRDFGLGRGFLLNLVVTAIGGAPRVGQTFARVTIIRGFTGATIVLGIMLQGYVTSQQGLGWPGSPIEHSLTAMAVDRFVEGTIPAAGAQFMESVPTGARWQVKHIFARLDTAAGGVNRAVHLGFVRATLTETFFLQTTTQAPSTSVWYTWAPNLPIAYDVPNLRAQQAIAQETILSEGDFFISTVINIAAGDQWQALRYSVREWLEVS